MKPVRIALGRLVIATLVALGTAAHAQDAKPAAALDLTKPEDNLAALTKMRCSLDPTEQVYTWWKGTIFAVFPGKAPQPIFGFEGYNVCRMKKAADGTWQKLSREMSFYRDLKTGALVDTWDNPFTGKTNEVLHVANDPVNNVFGGRGPGVYPWEAKGSDLMLTFNIPLTYPNPLNPKDWPEESSGEMYTGSEHFMFFTPKAAIDDPTIQNAPASYGWTRVGPWLPWMKMGTTPGTLLYIAQGHKIDGYEDLPADMRARIDADFPVFKDAPTEWTQPNATSWTYYRDVMTKRRAEAGEAEGTAAESR